MDKLLGSVVTRNTYMQIVEKAIDVGETQYAQESIINWLADYPGDLFTAFLYAKILKIETKYIRAIQLLNRILKIDPEFEKAVELLWDCERIINPKSWENPTKNKTWCHLIGLTSDCITDPNLPEWVHLLIRTKQALKGKEISNLEKLFTDLTSYQTISPLVGIALIKLRKNIDGTKTNAFIDLCSQLGNLWIDCLQIKLFMAESLISRGEYAQGILLIKQTVPQDLVGQVACRLWGESHPYQSLWHEQIQNTLPSALPVALASALGINALPEGSSKTRTVKKTDEKLEDPNVSLKNPVSKIVNNNENYAELAAKQGIKPEVNPNLRMPVYVIFSVKQALERKYGIEATNQIDIELRRLAKVIKGLPGWSAGVFYADDTNCTSPLGFKNAIAGDAWSLKLALRDLEYALTKRGERIGAVFIIGGPDIVPFHLLPNPVNDPDKEVPSDNPYAALDDNYFIPDWPVGRLPDDQNIIQGRFADPKILIKQIRDITNSHKIKNIRKSWFFLLLSQIAYWFPQSKNYRNNNFGYSAAVWRKASELVFQPIGKSKNIYISPPYGLPNHISKNKGDISKSKKIVKKNSKNQKLIPPPRIHGRYAYFNLHGLIDTAEWYGQCDPLSTEDEIDYPIALRPSDIPANANSDDSRLPDIVFCEACYGAHIQTKGSEQSIALKMLSSGIDNFIGSTSMSYGSVASPLIAGDFLGNAFWTFLKEGFTSGEALLRAKVKMVQIMHNRQGHLDGEDQKTLISFILYGDPLFQATAPQSRLKAPIRQLINKQEVKTISDNDQIEIPEDVISHVKQLVAKYLPGMNDAKYIYNRKTYPSNSSKGTQKENQVIIQKVTISKQIQQSNHVHTRIIHITMNKDGNLLKLTVSK